jgi:hypothetical protein
MYLSSFTRRDGPPMIFTILTNFAPGIFALRYHNSQAVVISALQVAKHPFITPGPSTVFTPPPTRHSTLPGVAQGVLAGIHMTGSLPHYYGSMTPVLGLKNSHDTGSVTSSGYPTPRPGSAGSGFDNSFYMGSPQIGSSSGHAPGNLFRSFPRPHSSPKMKLRQITIRDQHPIFLI